MGVVKVRKMCSVIKVETPPSVLLMAVVALSHRRDGGAGETPAHFKYCKEQYLLAQRKPSTLISLKEAPMCQRNLKTTTLGHKWLKETASVKQTGAHLLLLVLGMDPDSV